RWRPPSSCSPSPASGSPRWSWWRPAPPRPARTAPASPPSSAPTCTRWPAPSCPGWATPSAPRAPPADPPAPPSAAVLSRLPPVLLTLRPFQRALKGPQRQEHRPGAGPSAFRSGPAGRRRGVRLAQVGEDDLDPAVAGGVRPEVQLGEDRVDVLGDRAAAQHQ